MARGVTPEAIERADFPTALRGYDKEEVDAFLQEVAAEHRKLAAAASSATTGADKPYQRFGQDVGELLQQAKDFADRLKQRGEEEAGRLREEAKKAARETKERTKKEAEEIKASAEYSASERIKDAERRVKELNAAEAKAKEHLEDLRGRLRAILDQVEEMGGAARPKATQEQGAAPVADAREAETTDADGRPEGAEGTEARATENVVLRIDAESKEAPVSS